jgi:hypothetical protein
MDWSKVKLVVKTAILEGKVGTAIKILSVYYPEFFETPKIERLLLEYRRLVKLNGLGVDRSQHWAGRISSDSSSGTGILLQILRHYKSFFGECRDGCAALSY